MYKDQQGGLCGWNRVREGRKYRSWGLGWIEGRLASMSLKGRWFFTPSEKASHFRVEDTMILHKYIPTNPKIYIQGLWEQTVSRIWSSLGIREVLMRNILRSESWETTELQKKSTCKSPEARGHMLPKKKKGRSFTGVWVSSGQRV